MAKENDAIEEVVVQERRLSDKNPSGSGRGGNPFSGDAKAITQVLQGIAKGMFSPEGVANTISVGGYGIGKALKAKADAVLQATIIILQSFSLSQFVISDAYCCIRFLLLFP